ncbi:MAG: hypothetical protein GY927_19285 [bacterium]|nr:hypothetical protein [bacterium]
MTHKPTHNDLQQRIHALKLRQLFVKMQEVHRELLKQVLMALKEFEPPPI